jgi:hypothetical protein
MQLDFRVFSYLSIKKEGKKERKKERKKEIKKERKNGKTAQIFFDRFVTHRLLQKRFISLWRAN